MPAPNQVDPPSAPGWFRQVSGRLPQADYVTIAPVGETRGGSSGASRFRNRSPGNAQSLGFRDRCTRCTALTQAPAALRPAAAPASKAPAAAAAPFPERRAAAVVPPKSGMIRERTDGAAAAAFCAVPLDATAGAVLRVSRAVGFRFRRRRYFGSLPLLRRGWGSSGRDCWARNSMLAANHRRSGTGACGFRFRKHTIDSDCRWRPQPQSWPGHAAAGNAVN